MFGASEGWKDLPLVMPNSKHNKDASDSGEDGKRIHCICSGCLASVQVDEMLEGVSSAGDGKL